MEIREKIKSVLESHPLIRIATVDENGFPKVRSVDFAIDKEDESVVYFLTFVNTNKTKELRNNNNVYVAVDKEANSMEELMQSVYIKGAGKAYQLQTPEEIQKAIGAILEKYPYLQALAGDPSALALFKIELDKVVVSDNTIKFGHAEEYTYR